MTDEERRSLCDSLRHLPPYLSERGFKAADEIERLVKENKELRKGLHHLHRARETDMGTAE